MPDPTTILLIHVIRTLPENLTQRRELLLAMRAKMNHKHPAFDSVQRQIDALNSVRALQDEAQMQFEMLSEGGQS